MMYVSFISLFLLVHKAKKYLGNYKKLELNFLVN